MIEINASEFAEFVRERPDLAGFFHYVSPEKSGRRGGYYRRIPRTYYDRSARSPSQLKRELAFSRAAHGAFGEKGFRDGVPVVASNVKRKMKGRRFKKPTWKKAVEQLTESLKEIAKVVATKET